MNLRQLLRPLHRRSRHAVDVIAVDVETTGLDPVRNAVLELGWAVVIGGRLEVSGSVAILDVDMAPQEPEHPIVRANQVRLANARKWILSNAVGELLLPEIARWKARGRTPYIAAHSVGFEAGFLAPYWLKIGDHGRTLCTKTLLEPLRADGTVSSTRLEVASLELGLPHLAPHTAEGDACATARLAHELLTGGWL